MAHNTKRSISKTSIQADVRAEFSTENGTNNKASLEIGKRPPVISPLQIYTPSLLVRVVCTNYTLLNCRQNSFFCRQVPLVIHACSDENLTVGPRHGVP